MIPHPQPCATAGALCTPEGSVTLPSPSVLPSSSDFPGFGHPAVGTTRLRHLPASFVLARLRARRGRGRIPRPGRGKGARAELGMQVFNYTIKCTIRCNYRRSEGATAHNGFVIYCRRCLYCSAPLPDDYGKLSHLHGCHGNGGLAGRGWRGGSLIAPSPPSSPKSPLRGAAAMVPGFRGVAGAGTEGSGSSRHR